MLLTLGTGHANVTKTARKAHAFKMVDGVAVENPPRAHVTRPPPCASRNNAAAATVNVPKPIQAAPWVKNTRQVLRFYAYFLEAVQEHPLENHRVRRCTICYYLEDHTCSISEDRVENSGIPQGSFCRRGVIPKNAEGDPLEPEDLVVGSDITIYGRTFHICDCDGFTRAKYPSQPNGQPFPADAYTEARYAAKMRDTGADITIFRGKKQNPLKRFMEASLGNAAPRQRNGGRTDALKQFLENDRIVLQYRAVWDDRTSLFGDRHEYKINFFLADDTIEIREVYGANSGTDPYPCLLNRQRLLKNGQYDSGFRDEEGLPDEAYIMVDDLVVGQRIQVQNRHMLLFDCDEATYRWWERNRGINMRERIINVEEPPEERVVMEEPPYNGFGDEDDSLGSHRNLVPRAPRRDVLKLMVNEGKILRFRARLTDESATVFDQGRVFIVMYYLADDSVQVYEPPIRNSGVLGGKFLKRSRQKNPATDDWYCAQDFAIGFKLVFNSLEFELVDADEYTLSHMESNPIAFPHASAELIEAAIKQQLDSRGVGIVEALSPYSNNVGCVSRANFADALLSHGIQLSTHELLTIFRKYDASESGIDVQNFRAHASGETGDELATDAPFNLVETMPPSEMDRYVRFLDNGELSGWEELELERVLKGFHNTIKNDRDLRTLMDLLAQEDTSQDKILPRDIFLTTVTEFTSIGAHSIELLLRKFYPADTAYIHYENFIGLLSAFKDYKQKAGLRAC